MSELYPSPPEGQYQELSGFMAPQHVRRPNEAFARFIIDTLRLRHEGYSSLGEAVVMKRRVYSDTPFAMFCEESSRLVTIASDRRQESNSEDDYETPGTDFLAGAIIGVDTSVALYGTTVRDIVLQYNPLEGVRLLPETSEKADALNLLINDMHEWCYVMKIDSAFKPELSLLADDLYRDKPNAGQRSNMFIKGFLLSAATIAQRLDELGPVIVEFSKN
jgi:hypothetical protein